MIRPLEVICRPLGVDIGLKKLILDVCDQSMGSGGEMQLKFGVLGLAD